MIYNDKLKKSNGGIFVSCIDVMMIYTLKYCVCTELFIFNNTVTYEFHCFFYSLYRPQASTGRSDVLTAFTMRLIQYKEVHRELILTQSLVSELITTSLWAQNSKGFLAYHCFNYRERTSRRSLAAWEPTCLGENYTVCLQNTCGILTKMSYNLLLLPLMQ